MSPERDLDAQLSAATREWEETRGLMAAVARAYFLDGLPFVKIAEAYEMSRFRVARLLARARDEGIVTITINDDGLPDTALASRLAAELGLENCHVVRSHGDPDAVRMQVGAMAASLLSETLTDGEVLGVSWGRTLTATTRQIGHLPRLSIVQLTGVVAGHLDSSPVEVARQASVRSGGAVYPIFAPLLVEDADAAASLSRHPDIRSAMELFGSLTTALLSVGAWDPHDTTLREALTPPDLEVALSGGCVADIAGILVNGDGTPIHPELQKRCLNISYEQLRAVPRIIAVAAGESKAGAIRAVARAGLMTELVADHALALAVLGCRQA